ncbi:DNA/RNA non-specific endonuclease [Hymenobacter rubripertinctus]|uniref:DNA/RNA non-specific endonuclease n=1 Tax=Hymenobacter rubripertinctus TaxID=2029981 RepID=A0A418R7S3_9BACT|nr:DNA/RNA non-specific endonuclease [Hymenobacter rubripertinctus]RIY13341.1 DNA/RNA non-specific endonuclease [Hymenobacter rubripertinctus]
MIRLLSALLPLLLTACSSPASETRLPGAPTGPPAIPVESAGPSASLVAATLLETFETAGKGSYAAADETLGSGSWRLTEALIGSSDQDHKNGAHAARLRAGGRLTMNFDAPAGVQRIRISSAAYGQDAASTWELWGSQDQGRNYRRIGAAVRTQGPRLAVATFEGGSARGLRLEIRKTDTGPGRLNLDDVTLETAAGTAVAGSAPDFPAQTPLPSPSPRTAGVPAGSQQDANLALGNPSGATASLSTPNNYLLTRPQYAVGYNARRGTPTWVSWHLSAAWLGAAPRQDDFRPDPALPRQFYQVTPRSYSGSGFDRGHNCPSADRSLTLDDNSATFLMTNMIPQAGANNQRTWGNLEEWARAQVRRGQEIYVIMGSYGQGGTGTAGFKTTLDEGRVTVPARIWKVLVVLPEGPDDLRRIAAGQARLIAIDTPNDQQVSPDWSRYRVSLDALEAATGLDLLSALPPAVQDKLEAQVDTGPVR